MTAEFQNTSIGLRERHLIVHSEILNRSQTSWHSAEGWNTGYHLFDNPSGTLVIDGVRAPLELPPAVSHMLDTHIALPPEPGDYSVYVSVMREHVAWFYDQGWPFILIDVSVAEDGTPTSGV